MRVLQRVLAWFSALDPARRNRLLAALAVAVAAAVGVSMWASQEQWVPVVSGQGYDSALTAAAAVDKAGIPYQLAPPDALLVPEERLGAARAAIAAETHLPGIEEAGDLQFGLTPQAQEWAFLRAAEGDLARMLNGIDGVVASQVHVVPRGQSLYVGEDRPASAAVFLKLEPGATLQSGQVRAIVNLVANSVDGLAPDRVSVADDRGTLLASGDGQSDGPLAESRSLGEYRTQLESRYERAIAQALLPVLGYGGGFSATATVDLDLTSTETTTRQVDATRQAVVSEVVEETQESEATPDGGVPGVDANLPENGVPNAVGRGGESNRAASTVNYAYPTVDEVARRPAGGLRRLSVAVQVDQARLDKLVEASGGQLDAAALQTRIDDAVRASVGYDAARGDVVAVSYLPFAPADWTEGTEAALIPSTVVQDTAPYLVAALALTLLFWFVVRPVVGAVVRPLEPQLAVVDGAAAGELEEIGPDGEPVDPDAHLSDRLKSLVDNNQPIDLGDLNRLVDREAEFAADVLRKWARSKA